MLTISLHSFINMNGGMLTISQWKGWWYACGGMLTISFHLPIKMIEGLPPIPNKRWCRDAYHLSRKIMGYAWHFFAFLYKYDGGMLTMPLHFLINMMEGCLPFLNEDDGDMLGISFAFLYKYDGRMFTISQWRRWRYAYHFFEFLYRWKDAYHFSLKRMEICLPYHRIIQLH